MAEEKGNTEVVRTNASGGYINFITGNSAQCFTKKKKIKKISLRQQKLVKDWKISNRQESLTPSACVEDPLMLASASIVVTRGSRGLHFLI